MKLWNPAFAFVALFGCTNAKAPYVMKIGDYYLVTKNFVDGGFFCPEAMGSVSWIDNDRVYVIANTRGDGEFGLKWHQAPLRENRQKAFDDRPER